MVISTTERNRGIASVSTVVVVALVTFGLVATVGASGAAAVGQDDTDVQEDVPELLEEGTYENQALDPGESVTYDIELTQGDDLEVAAVGVRPEVLVGVTGPDGDPVAGYGFGGDYYTGVGIDGALSNGTYTVSLENLEDEPVTFDLEVEHDELEPDPDVIPDPLQSGTYTTQVLDAGETVTYEAELDEDEYFSPQVADPTGAVEVAVYGPDGDAIGELYEGDRYDSVRIDRVLTGGTYTVELTNQDDEAAMFDLRVRHFGPDYVPDPLQAGFYGHQVLDAGGTVTYDAELTEGDYFEVLDLASPSTPLDVAVYDPDGDPVGEPFELDRGNSPDSNNHGVKLFDAPVNGTYTVEIENRGGEAERFPFYVVHEPTTTLKDGAIERTIDRQEYDFYLIDLDEGDDLSIEINASNLDNLDVALLDPGVEEVGDLKREGDVGQIELSDVEAEGTYLIEMYNAIRDVSEAVDYELDVSHATADTDDGSNAASTEESNGGNETDSSSTDESTDGSDDADTDDTDAVPGVGAVTAILAFAAATVAVLGRSRGGSR